MDPVPEYFSKRDAAIVYAVSVGKIEAEVRAGRLRAFNVGKKLLLKKTDLDAWISSREVSRPEQCSHKSELRLLVDRAVETARRSAA